MFRGQSNTCLWLAAFLFIATTTVASPQWSVRSWQSDEGLPDNTVVGIDQTPDGFLWVATLTGLVRFDGMQFREFPVQTPEMSAESIRAFCADHLGRLWVAKEKGTIVCVTQGRVTVMLTPDTSRPDWRVLMMVEDGEGAVWVSFVDGSLVRIQDGKSQRYTTDDGLPVGGTLKMTVDQGGQLWVLGPTGVLGFRSGRFILLGEPPFRFLCAARAGGVWLSSTNTLAKLTEAGGFSEHIDLKIDFLSVGVTALMEDRSGRLWVGTRLAGLFCHDGKQTVKVDTVHQPILCMKEDREGNLWVGTRGGGLKQVKPRVAELMTLGANLSLGGIQSLCKDTEGQLWAVTWHQGNVLRKSDRAWIPLSVREGWKGAEARCVAADPGGGIWIGTSNKGLYQWQNGAVTHHFCSTNGLEGDFVTALRVTTSGEVWIGGVRNKGSVFLQCREGGTFQSFTLPADCGRITSLEVDAAGDCWAATVTGTLLRRRGSLVTDETLKLLPKPCRIRALLATSDNSLWIGFSGMGLGRLKEGQFTHGRMEQGIPDDYISQILADGQGRLWLAGNRGIFSFWMKNWEAFAARQVTKIQSVAYKQKNGMPGLQASYDAWPCALRDADGRLHFAMQSGMATLYPEEVREDRLPPLVVIDKVLSNGKEVALYGAGDTLSDPSSPAPLELGQKGGHLHLPPDRRQVEFFFTAPSFMSPESLWFKYRLQGLDGEWTDAGTRRSVLYSQLSPGHYTFHVIACNRDGVWNEQGASLALTVAPFWWETAWFRIAGPLFAFGVVGGLVVAWLRRRHKNQLERVEMQQAMERERSRIAADLHDGMGSDLTLIGLLCERARQKLHEPSLAEEYLGKALNSAQALSGELDAVVWSVNPANDTVEQFVLYLTRFVQNFLKSANIRLRLVVPDELPTIKISSASRNHLFLAAKEALHNVVKHAGAKQVTVRIRLDPQALIVELEDDGCGLPAVRTSTAGADGLANMARRMEQAGGRCEYLSGLDGRGTRVQLMLPFS